MKSICRKAVQVLLLAAAFAASAQAFEPSGAPRKKFIAFGWEFNVYKDPAFILANADLFESTGIDGVGFYLFGTNSAGAKITSVMHDDLLKREYFAAQVPIYRALTARKGFRHSFLKSFHAPTNHIDWTDDAHWSKVAGSMETVAWLAKSGGMKGICIDHEDYKGAEQFKRHEDELPYPELCELVRSRARQIFGGVFREFPDVVMLSYWFLSNGRSYFDASDPLAIMEDKGDLWPAFVNGMLDVMPPTARFVDGNETAYTYEDKDFLLSSVQQRDRVIALVDPKNRAKYRSQLRVGFGLYLDSYVNPEKRPDGTANIFYKAPVNGSRLAHFEKNASSAAYAASEYVWLWGEKLCWTPWRTKVLNWLGGGKTWEDALPGLANVLEMVKDPDGFLVSQRERLIREGKFVELVANPTCDPATSMAAGIHASTNATETPKPYIFWQAERRFRKGIAGVDVGGGKDGGSALVAKGVQNGCFVLHVKDVVPGEYYGVQASVKGRALVTCGWQKKGVWQWLVPDVCLPLKDKGDKDGWRTASGLVRIPEGVDDLSLKLSFNQSEGETTWVDDISVARYWKWTSDLEAHAEGRRNLITNFDHRERMGVDLPMGWAKHIKDNLTTKIDVFPQADGSVRFVATGDPWALYEQRNLTLVPGGKYRLSYEVKTKEMGGAPVEIFLHDSKWSWQEQQKGPKFPDDTKGEWVKQEAVVTMCDNPGATMHTLAIGCIHGQPASKVDFSLRNLRLEALDEATDRASAPIDAKSREKLVARIVPVDPLLSNVNADDAQITFYWPGAPTCGVSRCHVVSRFKGKKYNKPVSARFDEKGRATVRYGRVWPSKYEIEVEVFDCATNRLARNEYQIAVTRPEKPLTAGRRLNNFVTALVDQPLENGAVAFSRATPGWVWISFEGDVGNDAVGYLDDIAYPVARRRDGESRIEAQRFVSAGAHKLRISGAKPGGRLRINAVKTIWGRLPNMTTAPSACYHIGFRYTLPFCNRFGIHTHMNTCGFNLKAREHVNPVFAGYVYERGMRVFANVRMSPAGPLCDDREETWKTLTEGPWTDGFSISVDENMVNQSQAPWRTVNYSEAAWKMVSLRPEQSINLFYADTARGNWFEYPVLSASEVAATVNSGNGTGLICPEFYAPVRETPEQLDRILDAYAKFVSSANEMVPASRGKIVMYGASYVQIGDWSNYVAPATDIKAHYAKMYRAFATDPRFAGSAGVGCGGMICGGEELLRWMAKCVRYYALEGGTGDPAEEYGFTWTPGLVKNADMDEGLTNWTVKGEIVAERLKNYGSRVQKRKAIPNGYGDGVAVFTTRHDRPNELSQDISGLQAGKLYALLFCVADRDDILAKDGKTRGLKSPLAFSARLEGATELPNLRYETVSATRQKIGMRLLRYVFRADSGTARLVFTDRKDDGTAAPDGFRQVLNYVSFMPYYVESPDEPAEIAAALGWKDANRIRK